MVCFSPVRGLKQRALSLGAASIIVVLAGANAPVASSQDANSMQLTQLASQLSSTVSEIAALEAQMGGLQEAVNQALVDLKDAQIIAEAARQNATAAGGELKKAEDDMASAQDQLNELSRTAYRHNASGANPSAIASQSDAKRQLDRYTFLRRQAAEQRGVVEALDAERTKKANKESALRAAQKEAEVREGAARQAEQSAKSAITTQSLALQSKQSEREQLLEQARSVKEQIDNLRAARSGAGEGAAAPARSASLPSEQGQTDPAADTAAPASAPVVQPQASASSETSAEVSGSQESEAQALTSAPSTTADAQASDSQSQGDAAEASAPAAASTPASPLPPAGTASRAATGAPSNIDYLQLANTAIDTAQAVVDSGLLDPGTVDDPFKTLDAVGTVLPALSGSSSLSSDDGTTTSGTSGNSETTGTRNYLDLGTMEDLTNKASSLVTGSKDARIETAIARAKSQLGTPYAWGGGDATGPTKGIRDGGVADTYGDYNKVGFDCSGLVLYAFAGAGIALPHYTGYQYQRGTKVAISDIQRGDLLFWGPSGNQHVAIYLGDGQMIEAPQSGGVVQISPVRYGGMAPNAVRLI